VAKIEIKIGSRKSELALWQTRYVQDRLNQAGLSTSVVTVETQGDRMLDTSIAKIGSKGVFTEALEVELATGAIDIAVHSAKDMPSTLPEGFELIAFSEREQPADVLVSRNQALTLGDPGRPITIGTSSVRRQALLKRHYPHVRTVDIRGNLQTRIRKMDAGLCDGIIMAFAGMHRMGMDALIVHTFPLDRFVPPVGQGCIAMEAAASLPAEKRALIRAAVNHRASEACLLAERAFLRQLEGGCSIPVFALSALENDEVCLSGGLMSFDGRKFLSGTRTGHRREAAEIGKGLGAHILQAGGAAILAEIRQHLEA
jgi:hydroxymethylbilane synthase